MCRVNTLTRSISVLLVGAILLVSCASAESKPQIPTPTEMAPPILRVFVPTGSKSAMDLMRLLFDTAKLPYELRVYEGKLDGPGIQGVLDGAFDITVLVRRPQPDESVVFIEFLRTPVALVVNPDAGIQNLTREQVAAIFAGEITNWVQVGGADQEVVVLLQEKDDADTEAVRDYFMQDKAMVNTDYILFTDLDVFLVAEGLPGAIGYASWVGKKFHEFASSTELLDAISIDGLFPDDSKYPVISVIGVAYLPEQQEFLQPLFDWGDQIVASVVFKGVIEQFGLKLAVSESEIVSEGD